MSSPEATRAAMTLVLMMAEAIRTAGEMPSGHLYAQVMGTMDIHTFNAVITRLKKTGLVKETNHLLKWVGPKIEGGK